MFTTAGKAGQLSQRESKQGAERLQPEVARSPARGPGRGAQTELRRRELSAGSPSEQGEEKERGR